MRVIGLTGGIASGKSSVAGMLEGFGASVIDADQLARDVVLPGKPAYSAIVAEFGQKILSPDGSIDRALLGSIVFADAGARQRLEAITHPAIASEALARLANLRQSGVKIAVYVAPLLIEAGVTDRVDEIWVVYVDLETQISRLMARDIISRAEAEQKIASQMSMEEKKTFGRVVIDNRGSVKELEQQVRDIWEREINRIE